MARTLVLLATLAVLALIAFGTVSVGIRKGFDDPIVILGLLFVALIGFGAVGALTERRR